MENNFGEIEEELVHFYAQKEKEKCLELTELLFTHMRALKTMGQDAALEINAHILERVTQELESLYPQAIEKGSILVDTPQEKKPQAQCSNCFNLSEETKKFKKILVSIPCSRKRYPYQRSGNYSKFNFVKQKKSAQIKKESETTIKKEEN